MRRKLPVVFAFMAILLICMTLVSCAPCSFSRIFRRTQRRTPRQKVREEIRDRARTNLRKRGMIFVWEKQGDFLTDVYLRTAAGSFVRLTQDKNQELFPKWHPKENKIAYISRSGGEDRLLILALNELSEAKVVAKASQISKFRWCKKGEALIYSTQKDNLSSLYLINIGAEDEEPSVIEKDARNLTWTCDGKKTLYFSKLPGEDEELKIFKVGDIGSPEPKEIESGFNPVISSSSKRLLYQYPPMSDDFSTYLLETSTGGKTDLFPDEPARRWFHDFAFSLNEEKAVYVYSPYSYYDEKGLPYFFPDIEGEDTSKTGLYLVTLSSRENRLLYSTPYVLDPLFAPAGKAIIFTSKVSGADSDTAINSFDLVTEETTKLTGSGNAYHPDVR